MPTYIIDGPDGTTYEVDAPEGATETEILQRVQAEAAKSQRTPRSGLQTTGDFFGDVMDNLIPNWGDELIGGIPAAIGSLATDEPMSAAFDRGQAEFKANQAQYDEEHPNLAWASTLGGVGAGLLLPGGAVAKGAGMGAKMLQGSKIGAAYGTLSGAGEGDGFAKRADSAVQSGVAGAALGALGAPAFEGAARAHRFAKGKVPGYEGGSRTLSNMFRFASGRPRQTRQARATDQANRMLAERMQEGHVITGMGQNGAPANPEAIAAELERRAAMGVPAMPGDTTEALRNTTSWASRGMGPGQSLVRQRLDDRKAQEALRVRQHIIDTMGDVTDPIAQAERQAALTKARVRPLYDEAYAQPMVVTPEIEQIMATPAFRDAVAPASRNIRNDMRDPEAVGLRLREDGTIDPEAVRTLSTEGFDQVIRAMRDNGRSAAGVNPVTGQPIPNSNSVHITARAGELRDLVAAQNQPYAEAIRLYADNGAQLDALDTGKGIANLSGHEVNALARAMPEGAHESFALGARSALADDATSWGALHSKGNVAARIRGALGDETKQNALGQIGGNRGGVRQLQDRLEAEHQGNLLWSEARGNSATASRQAIDADVDGQVGATNPLDWKAMAGRFLSSAANRAGGQYRNDVKERVGHVLTEQDPTAFRSHLDDIAAVGERDVQAAAQRSYRANLLTKAAALNLPPAREDGAVLVGYDFNDDGTPYGQYGPEEDNFDADGNLR